MWAMVRIIMFLRLIVLLAACALTPAQAKDLFVNPSRTQPGTGTVSAPFQSLSEAFASSTIAPGDRLILQTGEYGSVTINNAQFSAPVQVVAAPDAQAHFDEIEIKNSSNLKLSGLQVWPRNPTPSEGSLVRTAGNASYISFDNMDIRSDVDAPNYRRWPLSKWHAVKRRGVLLRGAHNAIRNSQVTGAYIGISGNGDHAVISGNKVSGFSGDALRALGDFSQVSGNYVQDCIKINKNHDDGFQSWSRGPNGKTGRGTVRSLTIKSNIILEWNGTAPHPLRCSLQGIGLFDGMFNDLTIENNIVSVSAYHGISVGGAVDSFIVNNTVVNASGLAAKQPWISVAAHKNGTPPQRVIVANNAAMRFRLPPRIAATASRNVTISGPRRFFADPLGNDFRPRPGADLIGRANARYAPQTDIMGTPRPQGSGPDIGAIESR